MGRTVAPTLHIPDHELLHSIGRGSYGEVWLARNVLGTLRAVKIVRRGELSGPRPFEREYLGIQRFEPISRSHDGLVDILQVGRNDAEGFFYYVMELADPAGESGKEPYIPRTLGSDLATLGRLPPAECIRLFHGLATALAHLHRAGLVHRDIKPSNIVFVNGVPKFADIGLVAVADHSLSYVGTEGFIAPEGAGTVSSDIYSLGKVLYECGAGRDRKEFPVLPVELLESGPDQNILELNAIWLKACAPAAQDRYRNAEELAADLALLQAGRSVKGLRAAEVRLRRARRFSRVAVVVALVALVAGVLARRQFISERDSRDQERRLRIRAEKAEETARRELSKTRVAEARAILESRRFGRSAEALALLTNTLSPELLVEARGLAASALAMPDLLPISDAPAPLAKTPSLVKPQRDGSIWVYKSGAASNQAPAVVPSQHERVRDPLELSGDGRYLYAGYGQFTERVWDLAAGRKVAQLDTNYYKLLFRPGRAQAAVSYVDGRLAVHNLPGWAVDSLWTNKSPTGEFAWSPDGDYLLFATGSGGFAVVRPETNAVVAEYPFHHDARAIAWHPDGKMFAIAGDDNYLRVQNVQSWSESMTLAHHEGQVIRTIFLPPFSWILSASWDGSSQLWDWHAGYELGRVHATGYDIDYDPESRELTWRLGDETARHRWQLNGGRYLKQYTFGDPHAMGGPFSVAFSADNHWMAAPDNDYLRVWRLPGETEALRIPCYSQAAWLSPDGSELYSQVTGAVRHWKLALRSDGRLEAKSLPDLGSAPDGAKLSASSDGAVIAVLSGDDVDLWDHGSHYKWPHGQELAETIALSPDGRWVAVGTRNHIGARVFAAATRQLAWKCGLRYGTHLNFSADSRWLAIGTDHGCAVFDAANGALRWQRSRPADKDPTFWEVAFSPDGAMLAWTPRTGIIQLMDAATGAEILTLEYPSPRFTTGLAFSSDGHWLAEPSNKHMIYLWDIQALRDQLSVLGLGWK